jgi:hypothetical protein
MERLGGGASALLPRCILGLILYALAALIRTAYTWALQHHGHATALTVMLALVLLVLRSALRDGIVISSGLPPPLSCGHMTFLEQPKDYLEQYYSAASIAPCVLLSPAFHIVESAGIKMEVIIVPPALPPTVPSAAARTKKKWKKATAPTTPAAASGGASTAMPTRSTTPTMKKGTKTGKKKAAKPIDLHGMPMWATTTDSTSQCITAIAHGQKWVVSNATIINGDIPNKLSSSHQWYQKGPSGMRI